MFKKNKPNREGLFKGIVAAYTLLLLHLVLIAALGLVVVFLTGVSHYLFWILIGAMAVVALSAYLFFRKLRREGKTLGETLRSPSFQGRDMEISLLGGVATLRLGRPTEHKALAGNQTGSVPQLEDPQSQRIREIQALADLLENNLITREEFDQAKGQLFHRDEQS